MWSRVTPAVGHAALASTHTAAGAAYCACRRLLKHSSVVCMGFGSNMHDNDPEIIERERRRNLEGAHVAHHHKLAWAGRLHMQAT